MITSSCSTSDTRRVTLVTNQVICHEWGNDWIVKTTNGTYLWLFVTQIFHKCKMCKNKMFGYKTFLKKNKTRIKIIQRIFTRHQVKLHFRMSNPQLTPATIQIQYNYYSKSSFSSTIGILINAMNDLWYYNIIMPPTCIIGTSLSWLYDCWIYNYLCNVVNSNPFHGEVYPIQHYVIKFVSDLWQVGCFLRVLWCPLLINLTTKI
jgi:hypothetical protein